MQGLTRAKLHPFCYRDMRGMYKCQKIFSSMIIGIVAAAFITVSLLLIVDCRNYSLRKEDISYKLAEVNVVSFANVQGSRLYVVNTQYGLVAFMYEIASFANRYRFLWEMNIHEVDHAIILGRRQHFQVFISRAGTIEYNRFTGNTRNMNNRPYLHAIVSFLSTFLSSSGMAYRYLRIKRNKPHSDLHRHTFNINQN